MDIAYSEGTLLHAPIAGNMKVISIEGKNTRGRMPIREDKVEAGDPIGITVSDEIHVEYWVGGYHKGDAVNPSPLLILNGSDLDFRCLRKKIGLLFTFPASALRGRGFFFWRTHVSFER